MTASKIPSLTAVIPISRMADQLNRLDQTLLECVATGTQVILVHDIQDDFTGIQIQNLIGYQQLLATTKLRFLEGIFGAPGTSRNSALDLIDTDWTAFWDADDSPDVMQVISMINEADRFGLDVALGNFEEIDFQTGARLRKSEGTKKLGTVCNTALNPGLWRWAFRTAQIKNFRFPDIRMGEDQLFLVEISPFSKQLYVHPNVVYRYSRNRRGQLTSDKVAVREVKKAVICLGLVADEFGNRDSKLFTSIIFWKLSLTYLKNVFNPIEIVRILFKADYSNQIRKLGRSNLILGLIKVITSKI